MALRWSGLIIVLPALLCGQLQNGAVQGIISDSTGREVAGASVRLTAGDTRQVFRSVSATTGAYTFLSLPPAAYRLEVFAAGFRDFSKEVLITIGGRITIDVAMESGDPGSAGGTSIRTAGLTASRTLSPSEIEGLPNLTRDPYRLAQLADNISDAGVGTRGVGIAINGQRESSTNIVVDGVTSRNEFSGAAGQPLPKDAVGELSVATGTFTAEYGRAAGGIVNVGTMRGSSHFHGSAYEFGRFSSLASHSFLENANGIQAPGFQRHQFGTTIGGHALHNRLFYFTSNEGTSVRSSSIVSAWVVTPQLLALTAPGTQAFFQTLGQLRPDIRVANSLSLAQLTALNGRSPCLGLLCATLPPTTPILSHVSYSVSSDSAAGVPHDALNSYARVDYVVSAKTTVFARYGFYLQRDKPGTLSNSPYADYDLRQRQSDHSVGATASHEWNPRWVSQISLSFDRLTNRQQGLTGRGVVPTMYANPLATLSVGSDQIVFPGYNPFSPGAGGAFGGPQNTAQVTHHSSWGKGRHVLRFGGNYLYIRDNRTGAAYQTAQDSLSNGGGLGNALVGLQYGSFSQIQVAVDPQGMFPCGQAPTCSLTLPVRSPDFSRSNRFHEGSLYAQDYWHFSRRLALTLGVRWEHFGVQHNGNPNLDSNWYAGGVTATDDNLIRYLVFGGLQTAPKSPVGGLYRANWKDFAPRLGVAWDVFGGGKMRVRAGYGLSYDRNFGNVTFNVIQNAPNYAVLDVPGPITTANFGPLGATAGTISLPPPGARIIAPDLMTAYARSWNIGLEHGIGRALTHVFEYSESRGVDLYSVSYPNQKGFRNAKFGDFCTGAGDCRTSSNPYYGEDVGYRGNQGFSGYRSFTSRLLVNNPLHTGIVLTASYTWSHAVDNLSSTFFEAGGRGVATRFGDRNITTNNGIFDAGLLDPFQPDLDRGDAEFDVRHRVVVSGIWQIPGFGRGTGIGRLLHGWSIAPIFIGRSGQPFSVFDTIAQTLDINAPRATFVQPFPRQRNTFLAAPAPDTFHLITFQPSQISHQPNLLTPGSQWPGNMSARDAFRAPGFWNADVAVFKDTRVSERMTIQLRLEIFNAFNHANLYVIGASANTGAGNTVDACFGCTGSTYDRRQLQVAARLRF